MKINVAAIAKPERDAYAQICDRFAKMSGRYASVVSNDIFSSKVTRAQESGALQAKKLYSQLFEHRSEVTFFLGGAYGHGSDFLKRCDEVISLSELTMSHKVAKVVLFEQIYRALTILHKHPYHK